MAKRGRPTKFTNALGDKICAEIANGRSLRSICSDEGMPEARTVFRWLRLPSMKEFCQQYARACEARTDAFAEDMIHIASTPELGTTVTVKKTPEGIETTTKTEDMLGHRRLQIDTLKWNSARMNPKKYGDKIDVVSDGEALKSPVTVFNMRPGDIAKKSKKE